MFRKILKAVQNTFLGIWKFFLFLGDCLFATPRLTTKSEENGVKPWSEIPHAKGLPLVGTLFELIWSGGGSQIQNYVAKRHDELGPIFRESMGGRDVLFVASPDLFTEIRKQEGSLPVPLMSNAVKLYHEIYKDAPKGLTSSTTEETWLKPRQMLNNVMLRKSATLLDAFAGYQDLIPQYMVEWKESSKTNISNPGCFQNIDLEIPRFVLHAFSAVLLGTRYEDHFKNTKTDVRKVSENLVAMFKYQNTLAGLDPNIAKTFGMTVWKNFVKCMDEALISAVNLLKEGIRTINNPKISHSMEEDGLLFNVLEKCSSEEEAIRILTVFFAEGTLTMTGSITWALYTVAHYPGVQEKILNEINSVCGENNSVTMKDLQNLHYLSSVTKEAYRMYPVACFTARLFTHDYVIGGYHIPAGKNCALSTMYTQRSPEYFVDPERFWPERWEKEGGSLNAIGVKNKNAYLPFGFGPRSCIGKKVAVLINNLLIATFVQNFKMQCDEVIPVMQTILVPDQPLKLKLQPRS